MVAASTRPRTCAYRLFQLPFWLDGRQFVEVEVAQEEGRTEEGKVSPPIVLPMKYCKVFCEFC